MAEQTSLALRDDGAVTLQGDDSVALVAPAAADCCCGGCGCSEAGGFESPDSYALQLGPAPINVKASCTSSPPLHLKITPYEEDSTNLAAQFCLKWDDDAGRYRGTANSLVKVELWEDDADCAMRPPTYSAYACLYAEAYLQSGVIKVDVFLPYGDGSEEDGVPDPDHFLEVAYGELLKESLPSGWCGNGFDVGPIPPDDLDPATLRDGDDVLWLTDGTHALHLVPCCKTDGPTDCAPNLTCKFCLAHIPKTVRVEILDYHTCRRRGFPDGPGGPFEWEYYCMFTGCCYLIVPDESALNGLYDLVLDQELSIARGECVWVATTSFAVRHVFNAYCDVVEEDDGSEVTVIIDPVANPAWAPVAAKNYTETDTRMELTWSSFRVFQLTKPGRGDYSTGCFNLVELLVAAVVQAGGASNSNKWCDSNASPQRWGNETYVAGNTCSDGHNYGDEINPIDIYQP